MPTNEPTAYLFLGEEEFLKEEAIEKIKSKYLNSQTLDLNYSVFYAREKEFNPKEIIEVLNTMPFMSKKRLIVLKDADILTGHDSECILNYLRNPRESSIFIVDSKSPAIKGEFLLSVSKLAKLFYSRKLTEADLNIWLGRRAHGSGKKISIEAISLIRENIPHDLHTLSLAMDNLILYAGKRPDITQKDVEEMICVAPVRTGFDLLDALERKDPKKAMIIFNSLQRQKKRETELLGLLAWQFRLLLRVKELSMMKNRSDMCMELGLKARMFEQLMHYASRISKKDIVNFLRQILAADIDIKSGVLSPKFILERLIVRMCSSQLGYEAFS